MAGVWTNNFKAIKNAFLCGDFILNLSAPCKTDGYVYSTVTSETNDHSYLPFYSPLTNLSASGNSNSSAFIRVGSGAAAPTLNDVTLGSELTPNTQIRYLSAINEKPTWNISTGEVSNVVKLTVQNVDSSPVTIAEWGIFHNYASRVFLLYRAVLDSPVTLAPNQAATLTLTRSVTLTDPVIW